MEKLLYETRGGDKRRAAVLVVAAVILVVVAVSLLAARGARSEGLSVGIGYLDDGGAFRQVSGGVAGRGDLFDEGAKQMFLVMGVVFLVAGAFAVDCAVGMSRCWMKIYEGHVEGRSYSLGWSRGAFYSPRGQIQAVEVRGGGIRMNIGGRKVTVLCRDPQEAFRVLTGGGAARR